MMRRFILTTLILSTHFLAAEQTPPAPANEITAARALPNPESVPLKWIVQELTGIGARDFVRKLVIEEQNQYGTLTLSRSEFLKFYRETLAILSDQSFHEPSELVPFIEHTSDLLREFRLEYEEVLNLASVFDRRFNTFKRSHLSSIGSNEKRQIEIKPDLGFTFSRSAKAQGLLLLCLQNTQTPEPIQKLMQIAHFAGPLAPTILGELIFSFSHLRREELLKDYQLDAYAAAIGTIDDPEALTAFYQTSSTFLHELGPSVDQFLSIARSVRVPWPRDVNQSDISTDRFNVLYSLEFLRFHIKNHAAKWGADRLFAICKNFREIMNNLGHTAGDIIYGRQPQECYKEIRAFHHRLSQFISGDTVIKNFKALRPKEVNAITVASVIQIAEQLYQVVHYGAKRDYLTQSLREASDYQSFHAIYAREPKMLQSTADSRFSEFARWNPPIDFFLKIFGNETVSLDTIQQTHFPRQFLALLKIALTQILGADPEEFQNFLRPELTRFFAMSPSNEELIELHSILRLRPVPGTRFKLEKHIVEEGTARNTEDVLKADMRKRLFLNFAAYELASCSLGKQACDLDTLEGRNTLRNRLEILLAPAWESYYPGVSATERRTLLFVDLLMHEDSLDTLACTRLLLLISDEITRPIFEILIAAIHQSPSSLGLKASEKEISKALLTRLNSESDPTALIHTLNRVKSPSLQVKVGTIRAICGHILQWWSPPGSRRVQQ